MNTAALLAVLLLLPTAAPDPFLDDAQLNDVFFLDAERGWVVGDRGAIWHTDDGGRSWAVQPSGVRGTLYSVCFVDEKLGFAAGGVAQPYTFQGTGIFLSTRDGGKTWHGNPRLVLPVLRRIHFISKEIGWAIGTPSALFPAGVFLTQDGGCSWRSLNGAAPAAWLAGELVDPHTGAVAGRHGAATQVQRGGIEPAKSNPFGLRNLRNLKLLPPVHGWLVGDGGLVMTTSNLGAAWQTPPAEFFPQVAAQFDFSALAVQDKKVWIAGTPGTRVFHTADAGRSWSAFPTGSNLPLEALAFVDDRHGWAVGALGTILGTEDGGRTWRRQRCGGTRAALLALVSEADAVPLELIAKLAGQEGYLTAVEVLGRRDVETPETVRVPLPDRLQQAVVAVGGSWGEAAWQFPLRQHGLQQSVQDFIDGWDRTHDGRGLSMLEAHLVRQIRLWRPEVIVTHEIGRRNPDPLGQLISQCILKAAEKAGDATAYPEQITGAGLEPWPVKRVFAASDPGTQGTIDVSTAKLLSRLGGAAADVAAEPRGLLQDPATPAPTVLGFRSIYHPGDPTLGRRNFFTGIALQPGGEARRELLAAPIENLAALHRIAMKRRNAQAILEQAQDDPPTEDRLLAQTADLIRGLDDAGAAQVLAQLARQYARNGRWPMAAELYGRIARRHPQDPLARSALLWLVQYYSSGEAAWREQSQQRYAVRQASTLAVDLSKLEDRPGRAAELGKEIERARPELFAAPALRFALAAAHRQQGYPRQAERFYLAQSRRPQNDAWKRCAKGEQWLAEPEGLPPKPALPCPFAPTKPRLDGRLDDAVWQKAEPVPLKSTADDDTAWPACAAMAYDREFLYLAVHCRRAPGVAYPAGAGPRPQDADLRARDRVDLLLDMDRDYATYYRLTIDHRGWTAESCWGDAGWNPSWFVAAAADGDTWTVEAAVPWNQLTGRFPRARDAWCVGVQRTVPGVGFQSWSTPASTDVVPEGFGYLLFE